MNGTTQYILANIKHARPDKEEPEWTAAPCSVIQLEKLVADTLVSIMVHSEEWGKVMVSAPAFLKMLKAQTKQCMLRIDYSEHTHAVIVRTASYADRKYFGNEMS